MALTGKMGVFLWVLRNISENFFYRTSLVTAYIKSLNLQEFEDSHRENTPLNKSQALMKSMNMDNWGIGTLDQLFARGSYTQINFTQK